MAKFSLGAIGSAVSQATSTWSSAKSVAKSASNTAIGQSIINSSAGKYVSSTISSAYDTSKGWITNAVSQVDGSIGSSIRSFISDHQDTISAVSGIMNMASSFLSQNVEYIDVDESNVSKTIHKDSEALAGQVDNRGIGALKASTDPTIQSVSDNYGASLRTTFEELKAQQRSDMRVSLRVAPLETINSDSISIVDRLQTILGSYKSEVNGNAITKSHSDSFVGSNGTTSIYGFLFEALAKDVGLVFPYTPIITYSGKVKYDTTDIFQSNLSFHNYGGTPVPTIGLTAKFTADTKENAKHMLAAMWFLKAVTRCYFGEQSNVGSQKLAGTPPPVLYLNGYGDYIFNYIPVVISGYDYTFPDDRDYTTVMFNLANAMKFVEYFNEDEENQNVSQLSSSQYTIRNMLPIQMDIKIQMLIQPNISRYTKNFDFDAFKQGIMQLKANPLKNDKSPQYSLEQSYEKSGWTW